MNSVKQIIICTLAFLLPACTFSVLPGKEKNFADYIPHENIQTASISTEITDNFAGKNFPKNCEWKNLERVVDGDTIIVEPDVSVRFIGIDTPETKSPTKKIQRGGLEAAEKTNELLKDSPVVCLIQDTIGDQKDIYGRTLSYIFTGSGMDVNAELLKTGIARGYFYFPFSRKEEFGVYEKQAKSEHLGLWAAQK